MATVEAGAVKASALDALGRRLGALEAAGGDAKAALDEARAARADAAKALAAAPAAPPSTNAAAPAEPSALEPRLAKLEADLAAADARLNQLDALDERLAKLEGATGAAPKSDARVAMAKGASESAASIAVLALSLEQRFAAGAPFAAELAALSQLGVGADALAPLKPFAESGAPSLAALAASWAKVEPAVAAAAPPPERSGWDRLLDHMRALVRVRRVGEAAESDESEPPAARIGAALERGDRRRGARGLRPAAGGFARRRRRMGRRGQGARGGRQGGDGVARRGDRRPRGGEGLSRREKEFFTSGALSLERRRNAPELVGHGSPAAVSRPAGARRLPGSPGWPRTPATSR